MSLARLARSLADLAVDYLDPDAVIVFGSIAQDRARVDSDVDLLVVGRFGGAPERRGLEFREAIVEIPVAVDAIFMTPDEFAHQAARPASFADTVARHGWLAYVRPGLEDVYATVGGGAARPAGAGAASRG
jgi:predicted nucleotidyltransferase